MMKVLDKRELTFNRNINGLQDKATYIDKTQYFVKLDDLNPNTSGEWLPDYDKRYSCISERLASIFVNNIQERVHFHNVQYEFTQVLDGDKATYGTTSASYVNIHEVEHTLSASSKIDGHLQLMDIESYASDIIDTSVENRFHNLKNICINNGVEKDDAHNFILDQMAFDVLTGNTDRLYNPQNFIIMKTENSSRLVNMDYGRTYSLYWTDTTESKYDIDMYLEDDLDEFVKNTLRAQDSYLAGYNQKEIVQFLEENQYEPFLVNKEKMLDELEQFTTEIKETNPPFAKFALVKIEMVKSVMESELFKKLTNEFVLLKENDFPKIEQNIEK